MIAFLIHGIQKDQPIPEKFFAFIIDSDNDEIISHTVKILDVLAKKTLLNIEILSHIALYKDEEIDTILEFTEDCEQFFSIPNEIAEQLLLY